MIKTLTPFQFECDRCKATSLTLFDTEAQNAVNRIRAIGWKQEEHSEKYGHGAEPDADGYVPAVWIISQRIVWDGTLCPKCVGVLHQERITHLQNCDQGFECHGEDT